MSIKFDYPQTSISVGREAVVETLVRELNAIQYWIEEMDPVEREKGDDELDKACRTLLKFYKADAKSIAKKYEQDRLATYS